MRLILLLFTIFLLVSQPLLWAKDEKDVAEEEEKAPITISYYQIKPSLIANLASKGKYIRCDIQLMTHDETFLDVLNLHGPAIRHTLLLLLSEQNGAELKTSDGKEALRKKALSDIKKLLKELSGKDDVESLFFTTFFVQ